MTTMRRLLQFREQHPILWVILLGLVSFFVGTVIARV